MRAFIDSSSLLKKYVEETGSAHFQDLLENVADIIVAPTCWLEIQSALDRRVREKTLAKGQREWLHKEVKIDFNFFEVVIWNDALEERGTELIRAYHLKTLDSIQLSSACLALADVFVTSDKQLAVYARKEVQAVELIT